MLTCAICLIVGIIIACYTGYLINSYQYSTSTVFLLIASCASIILNAINIFLLMVFPV